MSPQTKSPFSFRFQAFIWRMIANENQHMLYLELRDEAYRKASFAAIDLVAFRKLWEQEGLKEQWWIGLQEAFQEVLMLHGFKGAQNPDPQGVYMLDAFTGKLLWENRKYNALGLRKGKLLVKDPEEKYYFLDPSTGAVLEEAGEDTAELFLKEKRHGAEILSGGHYTEENTYFPKIAAYIDLLTGMTPSGTIEYIEYRHRIFCGFYSRQGDKLVNYLLVSDEEGNIVMLETLAEDVKALALESYFLMKDLLIFIKNRKELIIFEL